MDSPPANSCAKSSFALLPWRYWAVLLTGILILGPGGRSASAAGVTMITHGFNGNVSGWVQGMARAIPSYGRFVGTNAIVYDLVVTDNRGLTVSARKVFGGQPATDPSAEIILKLDWS